MHKELEERILIYKISFNVYIQILILFQGVPCLFLRGLFLLTSSSLVVFSSFSYVLMVSKILLLVISIFSLSVDNFILTKDYDELQIFSYFPVFCHARRLT